jgi:hypothetical protein
MFTFDYITVIGFNEHSKAKIFLSHIEKQGDMHKPFEFSCSDLNALDIVWRPNTA